MNTDDLKYKFEEYWTNLQNWCSATWYTVKSYFKALDLYEYIGWGVNGLAIILVIIAFIV